MKYKLKRSSGGFTIIELAVVVGMITILSGGICYGINWIRNESLKNLCVVQQKKIQDAVRAYSNLNGLDAGDPLAPESLIGPGKPFESTPVCPKCKKEYAFKGEIPQIGAAYSSCQQSEHVPDERDSPNW